MADNPVCHSAEALLLSAYPSIFIKPKYESHLNLYVQNAASAASSSTSGEARGDVNNLKQLTNTYIEVLNDDLVMQEMGKELVIRFGEDKIKTCFTVEDHQNVSADELRNSIFIESVPDTLVLKLKVITRRSRGLCCNMQLLCSIFRYLSSEGYR